MVHELPAVALALRIVAPEAGEGAALEENGGANALAVVNRVLLNIKHQRLAHGERSLRGFHFNELLVYLFYCNPANCQQLK